MKKKKKEQNWGTLQQAYDECRELVLQGAPFRIDLTNKNMTVGDRTIVKNGKFFGKIKDLDVMEGGVLRQIECLYSVYKRSIPGERSCSKERNKTQFMALDFEELTDDDVLYGARREEAQYDLEAFVLFTVLSGQLEWDDSWGTWFWRSEKDRDCVLLKNWLVKKEK